MPTKIIPEKWLPIKGYEGLYEVSNLGRVKSFCKLNKSHIRQREVIITPGKCKGYARFVACKNGVHTSLLVHRVVLESFVGPCPYGKEACHYDGDRANNRIENLRWGTHKSNYRDLVRHGRDNWHGSSEENSMAKLCEADVIEIRRLYASGELCKSISLKFGVDRKTISLIALRRRWKSVGGPECNVRSTSKINADIAAEIRVMYSNGDKCSEIAKKFGIQINRVSDIALRIKWKNAGGPVCTPRIVRVSKARPTA